MDLVTPNFLICEVGVGISGNILQMIGTTLVANQGFKGEVTSIRTTH